MATTANLLPPSAAMAGLYAETDNARGVWNAPPNVSVNAIRSFPGRGVLVRGARTLDGASLDWRCIPARRTAIMLEGSIRAMVANFLTGLWRAGAFAGAAAEEAFSVRIGDGEMMTAEDIADGCMRLSIRFAPVRPAEFILLRFEQKMAAN
ncbi:MAG: hypothetical protein ACE37J_14590 [Pikeienuella sp.]|uniref:hypothetical protein n=1 Tax=Pikeienuella sp. TaxID=2831957 RepID=UPI00391D9270